MSINQYHYRRSLSRVAQLCLIAIVGFGVLPTLAFSSHGDTGGLAEVLTQEEAAERAARQLGAGGTRNADGIIKTPSDTGESREAKDVVIPEFGAPQFRLNLIVPLYQNDLYNTGKAKVKVKAKIKSRVVWRGKISRSWWKRFR